MKTFTRNVLPWAALLMLAAGLSGCALGQRRNGSNTAPPPPQSAPLQQPTVQGAAENTSPATPPPQSAPLQQPTAQGAAENTSPADLPAEDDSAAELLNLINSLDAANQAGDALDDLPSALCSGGIAGN